MSYKYNNYKKYKKYKKNKSVIEELLENEIIAGILAIVFLFLTIYYVIKNNQLWIASLVATIVLLSLSLKSFITKKAKKKKYSNLSKKSIDKLDGFSFEDYLSVQFEKMGYEVKQTPKSNDYGADLIVKKGNEKIAVQAKRYKGKVGNEAIYQVAGGMKYYNCNKGMVVTNSTFTPSAIELAKKCNIELWNGYALKRKFQIGV